MTGRRETRRSARPFAALKRLSVAEARKRPGRVLVTLGTVALGAAALTSALTLGASVQTAADDAIKVEFTGVDVLQRSDQSAGEDSAGAAATGSDGIAARELKRIRAIDGVQEMGTMVRATAVAQAGDVARGISLESMNSDPSFVWQGWTDGRPPESESEVALSQYTLDELSIGLGDMVAIGHPGVGTAQYKVVGVVDTRGSLERLGSMYGIVTADVAEHLAGITGPNTVVVDVDEGTDVDVVVDDINRVAPIGLPQTIDDILSARRAVQLGQINAMSAVVAALASVSCLVAAITSATTTGASLASRRRTWALARCVGASRRHIGGLVAAEALVLGLLGSTIGVLFGLGLARLSLPLVGLVPGLPELQADAFTVTGTAVLLPVVMSVVLALAGAIVPMVLAARIPPSAALKATSSSVVTPSRWRTVAAAALLLAGAALGFEAAGVSGKRVLIGTVLVLVGAGLLLTPLLVGVARGCAKRSKSVAVRLGFLDVVRRPRAAAVEAIAVFLAVGMIALSWVAIGSVQEATSERLSQSPQPDLTVGAVVGPPSISNKTLRGIQQVDGVAAAVPVPFVSQADIKGRGQDGDVSLSIGTAGGDASSLSAALPEGLPMDVVRDDTVYIEETAFPPFFAKSKVTLVGPDGRVRDLKVQYVKDLGLPTLVSPAVVAKVSTSTERRLVWVALKPGVDRAQVVDEIAGIAVLGGQLPVTGPVVLDVRVASGLSTARAAAVAILAVAVLVAVIGAAATAALSIRERSREHATLRALGLDRDGLARLLATRVLFVSSLAALLGVVVGGALGVVASRMVLAKLELDPRVAVPVAAIAVVVLVTVLAVRVAALIPMERASYVPPSRALAQD
jgi:putative ABC transport system permease protein